MYYIIYPILYLFSLLPFFILYSISDFFAFVLYRLVKYRKDVVLNNLSIAFPEKTNEERLKIAKKFYQYFTDTFIESLKFISISKKQLLKRTTGDIDLINKLVDKGYNINLMAGHQFNWEYANLYYSIFLKIPFVGIYIPISNKALDKIFYNIRCRYGTILVGATSFKNKMHEVFKNQYLMGLAADQNPGIPQTAYWLNFFGKPTPFVTGPEKGAKKNNAAIVYIGFKKIKRGYYHFSPTLLCEHGANTSEGELTNLYRDTLEKTIKEDPANYLWSHRRFKFEYNETYKDLWIDNKVAAPLTNEIQQ
jgi:Kdo2-lipid IVA lauroyltransferase/acyltransferase